MSLSRSNYAGIPDAFAGEVGAKIVVIPVPYDGTSSWGKGADKGPAAMLEAAKNMELYDIETNTEAYQNGIFLASDIEQNDSPEAMVDAVEEMVGHYLDLRKFVTLIGGEHSVSIGSIRAFIARFEKLTVLQLDAHADLRDRYEGSTCNHACAMHEASKRTNLVQVGIRSMDISEKAYMNRANVFFAHDMRKNPTWIDEAIERMTRDVYITIDLDAFDPSILPSTGTPEPGGLLWDETLKFIRKVNRRRNIVGFDIVELAPNAADRSSDFLMAKLHYKLLSYIFKKKNKNND